MGTDWWVPQQWTWGDTSASGTYVRYFGGSTTTTTTTLTNEGGPIQPGPRKPSGPLAWLDDRVDEIAGMGRDLMEAA